jgi:hypothetical protein
MNSLTLNKDTWDICLNSYGNLSIVSGKYRVAQDVATACRLFTDEAIFQVNRGIPYLNKVLGFKPNEQIIKEHIRNMALLVPNVANAQINFYEFKDRILTGEIIITDNLPVSPVLPSPEMPENFYMADDVYGLPNVYRIEL